MPRNSKYVDAAQQVLEELGGGPVPSKTLIDAIVEKGLLPDRQYLYHNVLRKVRESDLFDTSKRGFVSLAAPMGDENAEDVAEELPVEVESVESEVESIPVGASSSFGDDSIV